MEQLSSRLFASGGSEEDVIPSGAKRSRETSVIPSGAKRSRGI
jgi:hypothetical protein